MHSFPPAAVRNWLLALRLLVAAPLEVVLVLVEREVVGAVGERPVCLAPSPAAGDGVPRAGGDVAREVRLAHHHVEPKVCGVLVLQLLGGGEDVGRPQVAAERGCDRRLAEPDRRFEDDELLPRGQRRLDLLEDVPLVGAHRAVGEGLDERGLSPPPRAPRTSSPSLTRVPQLGHIAWPLHLPVRSLRRLPHLGQNFICEEMLRPVTADLSSRASQTTRRGSCLRVSTSFHATATRIDIVSANHYTRAGPIPMQ